MPPICPNLTVGPHCFCLNADIHSDDEDADEEDDEDADDGIHSDDEDAGHHNLCFHNSSIFSVFDLNSDHYNIIKCKNKKITKRCVCVQSAMYEEHV